MDPGDETATYTNAVLYPMYESLAQFTQQLGIEPCLAAAWRPNERGTEWIVSLRQGVRFHDGTTFDAAAVVASIDRLLDPKRGLAAASSFRSVIRGVEAINASTVKFTLKRPYSAFPALLTIAKIVSPTEDRKRDLGRRAVGTGPYRFAEWKTGEYVLETRYEEYWGPKPPFGQLKWIWSTEPALMNMSVLAGEADIVNPLPPIFAEALQRSRRVSLLKGQEAAVFWIALNTKLKPLDDLRVRRALNYGTDRTSLIASQLRGYGRSANSPLAPSDFGYDGNIPGYDFDPAKARSLLREAGYGSGFTLNIAVQDSQTNVVEAIQGMWANIGVTLNIRQMETGVFAQSIFGSPQEKAAVGLHCMFASWVSADLDPENQLGPLYRSTSWSPAGANLGFYRNRAVDELLDRAAAELNSDARQALYSQAQRLIVNDAPHVLLYYSRDLAARRSSLSGFWLFPGGEVEPNRIRSRQ